MTFLPIVERELRVRARSKGTYLVRALATAFALLVVGINLVSDSVVTTRGLAGQLAFIGLTLLAMLYCLAEGARSTADCLSKEKREGTLGLLFLTDLKGYDVVLGKLAATSVNSFYGLLAMLPVMALPLLAGGVSFPEFCRVALVLVTTMFFSLCVGLWVSARSEEEHKARRQTVGWLAAATFGLVLADALVWMEHLRTDRALLSIGSPAFACYVAMATNYAAAKSHYWCSILFMNATGWVLLWRAGRSLARRWCEERESTAGEGAAADDTPATLAVEGPVRPAKPAAPLLDQDPVQWLVRRNARSHAWLWLFLLGSCLNVPPYLSGGRLGIFSGTWIPHLALQFGFWYCVTALVCRPVVQLRQSDLLELLTSTPLGPTGVLRGLKLARRRRLDLAVAVGLGMLLFSHGIPLLSVLSRPIARFPDGYLISQAVTLMLAVVVVVLKVCATEWMGTWMALSVAQPRQAVARTFLAVEVLPTLLLGYAPWFLIRSFGLGLWLIPILLQIAANLAFIRWARVKLAAGLTVSPEEAKSFARLAREVAAAVVGGARPR